MTSPTIDGTTPMTADTKKQQKPMTIDDARRLKMRRVLMPLYWEWVEKGKPLRT